MKRRFPSLGFGTLVALGLTSPAALAAPALSGGWTGSLGADRTLTLSLTANGSALRGEATLPALAWVDAGRYQVRGQMLSRSGQPSAQLRLSLGSQWVYDLTCQPEADLWNCTLETWRGGDRSSAARAWRVKLQPAR